MHLNQLGTEVKCDMTLKKTKQCDPLVNLGKNFLKKSVNAGFPRDSDGKESTCNAGDPGSIPGLGRSPGGGQGNPLRYSSLENPHGQRSLAGYRLAKSRTRLSD